MNRLFLGKSWMFGLLPPLFAYLLTISVFPQGLLATLRVTINLAVLLSPFIGYTLARDRGWIGERWKAPAWGLVFVIFPPLAYLLRDQLLPFLYLGTGLEYSGRLDGEFPDYFFLLLYGVPVATEALLWLLEGKRRKWRGLLSTRAILIYGGLFSLLVCLLSLSGPDYWFTLVYWPQVCLIFLVFYGYYLWNARMLIPNVLGRRGLIPYVFAVVGSVLLTYPFAVLLFRCLPAVKDLQLELLQPLDRVFGGDAGGTAISLMLLSAPFLVSSRWLRSEAGRSEAELQLLREQINPHFFFNTLNNLYALSIEEDERTPGIILRLSDLMRYVIYAGRKPIVPLGQAIRHLEDYRHLQLIRLQRHCDFRFTVDIPDNPPEVPPLLFINLVENAFKHGVEPAAEDTYVHLELRLRGRHLTFRCENSVEQPAEINPESTGLANLRQRLALRYPDRHELKTVSEAGRFLATLKIDL